MNPRIIVFLLLLVTNISPGLSQSLNLTDQKGLKQGHWIRKYPTGITMYDGWFRDGHPVGEFKRFNEYGALVSIMNFSEDGRTADAQLYYPDGKISSRGRYVDQKKEGKWQFFSPDDGYLMAEEIYKNDLKNGLSVIFYPDSTVADKVTYAENVKEGVWERFHENGKKWIRTVYLKGLLHGRYEAWFDNGNPELSGTYRYNIRQGHWIIYHKNGTVRYRIEYKNGVPDNRQMDLDASKMIDSLEKNRGSIPDPEKTGIMW
jgi:antitoxin component YwqK of YwqJK toxin-antitoxin module